MMWFLTKYERKYKTKNNMVTLKKKWRFCGTCRRTSPDRTTDETIHKEEKHQQQERLPISDSHTVKAHVNFMEP